MIATYAERVDSFPIGEMSGYDPLLDTAVMVGRYRPANWRAYYELCRGGAALPMTKWFNTNYHYLAPQLESIRPDDLCLERSWIGHLDPPDVPAEAPRALIGPYTLLRLSRGVAAQDFADFLLSLAQIYRQLLGEIGRAYVFEPGFALDPNPGDVEAIRSAYTIIGQADAPISLFVYYDSVDFLRELYDLPLAAIGLDLVHGRANLEEILAHGFPTDMQLIAGLIDGRSIWRSDITTAVEVLRRLSAVAPNLAVSNAAPLFHLPLTLAGEQLDPRLMRRMAFAIEKLDDIRLTAQVYAGVATWRRPAADRFGTNAAVQQRVRDLTPADGVRTPDYAERRAIQDRQLNLPLFPTTTIGSFPQTSDMRRMRARFRKGEVGAAEYNATVHQAIGETIRLQEEIGLDVLVHGESERSDMVEFFAEKLEGVAFTKHGWVISYGNRGYRPPIIYGDVARPAAMTTHEVTYAQSRTTRPVKGMLTGPVTILAWSFVRDDIPTRDVARQIGLALRDEVADYERAGIRIVQIDEPAFREMAPNKRRDWDAYFDWAVEAFRICAARARPETQIHSHMCYSDFGAIINRIQQMDFDVISIEASRSRGEVLESFERSRFMRQIGIGVYDIHSPVIPKGQDIAAIIERAIEIIPRENFWINPDCGLKTRTWEEVTAALRVMVEQARLFRARA